MSQLRTQILTRKEAAWDSLATKRELWDDCERLFHNQLADSISKEEMSEISDPKLATFTLERSYRVMSQLATGKVKGISKNDIGGSMLMNLIIDKYINPNANAQFDLLTKFRMADMYSNIYGNYFSMIDWDVKRNGYIGPDMWLLNIRDVFPQVGAVSLEDSDYIIVRTWKPLSYFEGLAKNKNHKKGGYKNLSKLINKLKDKSGSKHNRDDSEIDKRESKQYTNNDVAKGSGYFEVLSMYERDRWSEYCVDAETTFRDTDNMHDNGELPVSCKYAIPLLGDFFGMADFERGMPLQKMVDSMWNLYMGAVRMSIFPPVLINKDNIAVPSSANYIPGAKWIVRNSVSNSAQPIQLNPQGISTFNNTYQVGNAALLNLFGTTDTAVSEQTEAGFGKTPKALNMQQARENSRDNADRYYMERFVSDVYGKFINLIGKKQDSAITIRMFEDEIEELARSYEEVNEMYDPETGKLTIDKGVTGSNLWDYEVEPGSTYAVDQKVQLENIQQLISMYMGAETPQGNMLDGALQRAGYTFNFGELFKKSMVNSGIQDWDKVLTERTEEDEDDAILENNRQQFEAAMMEMMGGGGQPGGGMPPQGQPPIM